MVDGNERGDVIMRDEFESRVARLATREELLEELASRVPQSEFMTELKRFAEEGRRETAEFKHRMKIMMEAHRQECNAAFDSHIDVKDRLDEVTRYLVKRFDIDSACIQILDHLFVRYRELGRLRERDDTLFEQQP